MTCERTPGKISFWDKKDAVRAMNEMIAGRQDRLKTGRKMPSKHDANRMNVYQCRDCGFWHVGRFSDGRDYRKITIRDLELMGKGGAA